MFNFLRASEVDGVNVDSADRMRAHGEVLAKKPLLQQVFREFHEMFRALDDKFFTGVGKRIELGAGVAPIRDTYPDVLATDIVEDLNLDLVLNAQDMDLEKNSVRSFYGQNCFHHFPQPSEFFAELDRTLVPGGGAIVLEPYYGPLASFLYKRLFKTEGFDKKFPKWETPADGPMHGANQALSYIVFVRDREIFEEKFPNLEIVHQEVCKNHLKYLISGGLNFNQLLPNFMGPVIEFFQWVSSPFNRWTALHHVVVIQKV